MADLKDLYQEILLDHYRRPRNRHKLEQSNRQADGINPLCGDKLSVYLQVENGTIRKISFDGTGCAISIASASMMTESLQGKTEEEARTILARFLQLLTAGSATPSGTDTLGDLSTFSGVREYPVRVKCATLAWHTFRAALEHSPERVSTE